MSLWAGTLGPVQMTSPSLLPFDLLSSNPAVILADQLNQSPWQQRNIEPSIWYFLQQDNRELQTPFSRLIKRNIGHPTIHPTNTDEASLPHVSKGKQQPTWPLQTGLQYQQFVVADQSTVGVHQQQTDLQQQTRLQQQLNKLQQQLTGLQQKTGHQQQNGENRQHHEDGWHNSFMEEDNWMYSNQWYWVEHSNSTIEGELDDSTELEELQQWMEEKEEENDTLLKDFQFYILMLLPFFVFGKVEATYFIGTKLLSFVLGKLGFTDADSMVFVMFVQCIDMVALSRGRLKFAMGYQNAYYQKIYDYMVKKMKWGDVFRIGSELFMAQTGPPKYEDK